MEFQVSGLVKVYARLSKGAGTEYCVVQLYFSKDFSG